MRKWLFRIKSFVVAMLGGRIEDLAERDRVIKARLAICSDCEHIKKRKYIDQETFTTKEQMFCSECGCGTNPLAELNVKLGFKNLRCPLDPPKWGFVESMNPKEATHLANQQIQTEMMQDPRFREQMKLNAKKNEERQAALKAKRDQALRERGIDPATVDEVGKKLMNSPVPHMSEQEIKALVDNDVIKRTMTPAGQVPQNDKEQT